jgi:hypothetical protein
VIQAQELTSITIQQALLNTTIWLSGLKRDLFFVTLSTPSMNLAPCLPTTFAASALAEPIEGVATVDSNTIYRIASISKLLIVYMYLITAGGPSFNDPITKYVPELAQYDHAAANVLSMDDIDSLDWKDITTGSLASHLTGVGRDASGGLVVDQLYL